MAMYLNDFSAVQIQCARFWSSTTFLDYIHNQIDVVTCSLAQSMSITLPFINMTW